MLQRDELTNHKKENGDDGEDDENGDGGGDDNVDNDSD